MWKRTYISTKLNDSNLTFGTQNYAVKKTFVPNDKLEMLYLAEEVNVNLVFPKNKHRVSNF